MQRKSFFKSLLTLIVVCIILLSCKKEVPTEQKEMIVYEEDYGYWYGGDCQMNFTFTPLIIFDSCGIRYIKSAQ